MEFYEFYEFEIKKHNNIMAQRIENSKYYLRSFFDNIYMTITHSSRRNQVISIHDNINYIATNYNMYCDKQS